MMRVFRHKNLVYIPFNKIASRSFTQHFRDLAWQESVSGTIDWREDHVFAHLINPFERHVKGLAECIWQRGCLDLCDDPRLFRLLCTHTGLDIHTYPLSQSLGSHMRQVDWLLLDHEQSNQINHEFFSFFGIPLCHINIGSVQDELEPVRAAIREVLDQHRLWHNLHYAFNQDIMIYNGVKTFFDFANLGKKPWPEISWLQRANLGSWWDG